MTHPRPTRTQTPGVRIRRARVAGLLAGAAVAGALLCPLVATPSSSSPALTTAARAPGVTGLHPELLGALRRAEGAAAEAGVRLTITSGRRSPERQEQLLREAIAEHGSAEEAARWVATAETSAHVSGDAVDIGPPEAAAWLGEHGSAFGLCRVYANEPWHFELRPEAAGHGCPAMYADPTHDPRMRG